MWILMAMLMGAAPAPALAQICTPPAHPMFELVQFVVDTLGDPIAPTLKFLRGRNTLDRDMVSAVLARWHFTPAMFEGCRVQQLVQTSVEP